MAQITLTNLTSSKLHVPDIWRSLNPGESETISRTEDQLMQMTDIRRMWAAGELSVTIVPDAGEADFNVLAEGISVAPTMNFVFRPGGVAGGNVFTSWSALMAAKALVQGMKTIQFDDSITSPCVIPAGTWDMTETELTGLWKPSGIGSASFRAVSIADGASFTNLRKIGGDVSITNLNNTTAPVIIGPLTGANNRVPFEIGIGLTGDFPLINNNGTAPFFDCTQLLAGQAFFLRGNFQITGTSPAIQFGAGEGNLQLMMMEARINSGMIAGTSPVSKIVVFYGVSSLNRQDTWAGDINYGTAATLVSSSTGGTPWMRTWLAPAPVNQVATAPSTVALTTGTGLGMNATLRLDATAGVIAQTLPMIRAAAPAIGSSNAVAGVLNSQGMVVVVREFSGVNGVNLSPSAGETIEGGAGPLLVPAGGSRILQSDGISDWRVIAGYL